LVSPLRHFSQPPTQIMETPAIGLVAKRLQASITLKQLR